MMKSILFIVLIFGLLQLSFAQSQAGFIKEGNKQFRQGNLEGAITIYSKVTVKEYKYIALMNKGTALYKQKRNEEALVAYNEAANIANISAAEQSAAYYNSGVVYSNQNKTAESIEAYKMALRLKSDDVNARENLQKALSQVRRSGGAGGANKPQPSASRLSEEQVKQQLNRLRQKEKATQINSRGKKGQLGEPNGKDW